MLVLGKVPGSLAMTNIAGNAMFGSISGSGIAAATAIGGVMQPLEDEQGYDRAFSAAANVASAPVGQLIPPTASFIVFSAASGGVSVAALLMAGWIPGLLWALLCMIVAFVYGKKHGYVVKREHLTSKIVLKTIWDAIPSLFLIVIIIGGILSGYFTPTEASGVAVVYAFILSVFVYKSIKFKDIPGILRETAVMTAIVMLIIGASSVLSFVLSFTGLPQLERIMYEFVNGEIDVLVSTTIIETGMDIPNCNTMIIENADQFGLSQLYQLRGRVGRSTRTSYAFLMYKRDKMISEVAEKRLSAIKEFSDLGSGFKIAMKDLEIRGAGNVLGKSQHGHMAAVGYDLYCKMLNQAVNDLKGIKNEYDFETTVDMEVDAYIPATYIKSEYQKLDIYKRIAALETREELSDMRDELADRYGSIPSSAANLLMIALIKTKAHKIGIMDIKGATKHNPSGGVSNWRTVMTIYPKADINSDNIQQLVDTFGGALEFKLKSTPEFVWTVTKRKFSSAREYLDGMLDMMDIMEDALGM